MRRLDRLAALAALTVALAGALAGCPGPGTGQSVDAGPTVDAPPNPDGSTCDPDRPPSVAPELHIGPQDLQGPIGAQIDAASQSIDVQMYGFTLTSLSNKLIAAKNRGVAVRVILDQSEASANANVRTALLNAGIPVQWAPSVFPYSHAKYLLFDHDTAFILSGNLSISGMVDQRNAGLIDRDPTNVSDLSAIFAADWAMAPDTLHLDCPRLMISPADARTRVLNLIASARSTLDIEVYYIADVGVRTAVVSAKNRGVAVRVILAEPSEVSDNDATATALKTAGVPVRMLADPIPHIKLIIADGAAALVGSHNMSESSLRENREIGEISRTPAVVSALLSRLDGDWNLATPW
ncbi:MAG TPA: phospholipase D-like domain-containing protein [Kofleriaceae bacterium]|nr:phospholipase D-like domain-containing protein [Kofleriaceae bacterium]